MTDKMREAFEEKFPNNAGFIFDGDTYVLPSGPTDSSLAIYCLEYRSAWRAWQAAQAERKDKPAECVNGCPDKQVCDYCQSVAAIMPCGASVTNVYEAYAAGKKAAQSVPVVGEVVAWVDPKKYELLISAMDDGSSVNAYLETRKTSPLMQPLIVQPIDSITAAELERLRKDAESYRRLVEAAKAEADTHCTYPDCICPDGVSMGSCNLGLPDAAIAAEGEKE